MVGIREVMSLLSEGVARQFLVTHPDVASSAMFFWTVDDRYKQ